MGTIPLSGGEGDAGESRAIGSVSRAGRNVCVRATPPLTVKSALAPTSGAIL